MKFISTDLKPFENGQLCFVVLRNFQGKGPFRWILHEADTIGCDSGSFSFGGGSGKTWVISPASMMGLSTSARKKMSSRLNGKKGGRPKRLLNIPILKNKEDLLKEWKSISGASNRKRANWLKKVNDSANGEKFTHEEFIIALEMP